MKYSIPTLACLLQACLSGCMDYIRLAEEPQVDESVSFPPMIDIGHLSPLPSRLTEAISVGKNCKGMIFKVPPIGDRNAKDRLHYLWFLDNKLASPPSSSIEPQDRKSAILTLNIDEQFLISLFETRIPKDFFERTHVLEFFVSNVPYDIPESKYINDSQTNEKNHGDYAYWIISFSNDNC